MDSLLVCNWSSCCHSWSSAAVLAQVLSWSKYELEHKTASQSESCKSLAYSLAWSVHSNLDWHFLSKFVTVTLSQGTGCQCLSHWVASTFKFLHESESGFHSLSGWATHHYQTVTTQAQWQYLTTTTCAKIWVLVTVGDSVQLTVVLPWCVPSLFRLDSG